MSNRGVSTVLGYVLGLAVITVMITGLFITTEAVVSDQREKAIRSELRVIGNQIAADITTVDRLASAPNESDAHLIRNLPKTVAGTSYEIHVGYDGTRPVTIDLTSDNPEVSVTVRVMNGTEIENSTTSGGTFAVYYNGNTISLESNTVDHSGDLIRTYDDDAGASPVTMEVNFEIQPGSPTIGNSLDSLEIRVESGDPDMFSGTDEANVSDFGVDTDGDGTIDNDIQGDIDAWDVTDGGSNLKIGLGGSAYTNAQAGDTIILVLENVDNPASPGTYDVEIQTSGDGNWQYGTIEVS